MAFSITLRGHYRSTASLPVQAHKTDEQHQKLGITDFAALLGPYSDGEQSAKRQGLRHFRTNVYPAHHDVEHNARTSFLCRSIDVVTNITPGDMRARMSVEHALSSSL